MDTEQQQEQEERKRQCKNCLQDISEANFMLHELRCAKHVALCEQCGEAVAREELQQHYEEEHAPVACQHCGDKFPREQIDSHTDTTCPAFKMECKYCELEVARKNYTEHVDGCGSRTDICELCSQRVRLRDMYEHTQNKCRQGVNAPTGVPLLQPYQDFESQGLFFPLSAAYGERQSPFGVSQHQPGVVHPFVPLPAGPATSHARLPHTQLLSPPDDRSAGDSLHVDPQWLASVAGVCGEDNLDQVLAQNMIVEDYQRRSPPSHSPPKHYDQVAARGAEAERDAALALQVQRAEQEGRDRFIPSEGVGYTGDTVHSKVGGDWGASGGSASMEERDAELARQIHERDLAYAENQRRDQELAERLQAAERQHGDRDFYDHGVYEQPAEDYKRRPLHGARVAVVPDACHQREDEDVTSEDSLLSRRFQLEEEEAPVVGGYDAAVLDNEHPRPKTPPPSLEAGLPQDLGKIPCEYCYELYPFEGIYDHQRLCYAMKGDTSRDSSAHKTMIPRRKADRYFPEQREESPGDERYPQTSHGVFEQKYDPSSHEVVLSSYGEQSYHPPSDEGMYYQLSSEGVPYASGERSYYQPSSEGFPYTNGERSYHQPSSERVPSSSKERSYHQPSSEGVPSSSKERSYHQPSSEGVPLSSKEWSYHQPSSEGVPSSSKEWSYHQPSSEGVPSSSKERSYHQPSSEVVPSSNGERSYHQPSSERIPSSSKERSRHQPSSEVVPPSKEEERQHPPSYGLEQRYRQPSNEVLQRNEQRHFQPSHKVPTLSSREQFLPPPAASEKHSGNREGGVLLTDDLLRQISANSKEPLAPHAKAQFTGRQEGDYNSGPCEVCGKLFSIKDLVKHEATCKYRLSRKDQVTPLAAVAQKSSGSVQGLATRRKGVAPVGKAGIKETNSRKSKEDGGANSRREELSVEGLQVAGVGFNSDKFPTPVSGVGREAPKGRATVPKETTAEQHSQGKPRFKHTKALPYSSIQLVNPAQNGVPATEKTSSLSLQGRNGVAKKAESVSQTGRSLVGDGVPREFPAREEWRVQGVKMTTKQNDGHAP